MPINLKVVPKTVDEAINSIVDGLDPTELEYIKNNGQAYQHFTTGMAMRNEWGLWKETSPIKLDFQKRFNLFGHGDDISGIILDGVWAKVRGDNVERTLLKAAERFRFHWRKSKVDPETGKTT